MPKITDPKTTRRVLETAAVLQNFDLDSLSLYSGFDHALLTGVLFENQEFFERRPTHGRNKNIGGRWLVRDHTELLLHAIELAPPETVDLTSVPGPRESIDPAKTRAASAKPATSKSAAAKPVGSERTAAKRAASKPAAAANTRQHGVTPAEPTNAAQTPNTTTARSPQPAVVDIGAVESSTV